jgi:alpha-tubulin suppressor-like RCC1 family protein
MMKNFIRFSTIFLYVLLLVFVNSANAQITTPAISAGFEHTCALTRGGAVKCWGENKDGQLGDGTTTSRLTPVLVDGLSSGVVAIEAGRSHTCALTNSGAVKCWGYNEDGELGDGTMISRLTPVLVSGLSSGVKAINVGRYHTCAINSSGAAICWGYNVDGQLGDGTTTNRLVPVPVNSLSSGVAAIAAGIAHTCAITNVGAVKCWGENEEGALGDGTTIGKFTPVPVNGLSSNVVAIAVGSSFSCALTAAGTMKCWGYNYDGELGDGTTTDQLTPITVDGLNSGVLSITAGLFHACAITVDGAAKCWGNNEDGQIGDGNQYTSPITPTDVFGLSSNIVAISAGYFHTCALTDTGAVKCWGSNLLGQLGDGTNTSRLTPLNVDIHLGSKLFNPKLFSIAAKDGWVLESTETSKKGGKADSSSTTLIVGDSAKNQAYRSVLHFDTTSLPNNAVIIKATLTLKKQSLKGDVKPLGNLWLDMKQKNFGSTASLKANDFEATAGKTWVGKFKVSGNTYTAILKDTAKGYISKTAATQFKLGFNYGDNNDKGDDYLKFYSGNASSSLRPSLVIEYYVP